MNGDALSRIRIVLVQTTHPGNIGAAARALKTMGLARLYLVNPRRFPDPDATAMASGADDVLAHARVCATLDEALAGTTLAVAVTARRRELTHPAHDARGAAGIVVDAAGTAEVALVFGTEMAGLSNEEVIRCQRLAHIPATAGYSSLNLAQAVQILAYEIRVAALGGLPPAPNLLPRATYEEVEAFYAHLEASVIASGFLDPAMPKRFMERVRRLFGRAGLEKEEVSILRGMLASWDQHTPRK